jgi:hypothetical protein
MRGKVRRCQQEDIQHNTPVYACIAHASFGGNGEIPLCANQRHARGGRSTIG